VKDFIRKYTNTDGAEVEVSREHLNKAVDVKLELQNISPSRKCNWSQHRSIMEEEGFFDSDINEKYRCLIKDYQKSIGRLHSLPEYADFVADGKLEAIKKIVGDVKFEAQINRDILRKINMLSRELTRTGILVEEFRNALLDELEIVVPKYVYQPKLPESKNKAIVIITDWHIGAVVDNCLGNSYSYEIAEKRVSLLKHKVLERCKANNINDIVVVGLGDWVEHLYMRSNQNQDCEFPISQQIVKAKRLILDFIVSLSSHLNVTYTGIAGNHDRMEGDKTKAFDGDNANVVINEGIEDIIKVLNPERLNFIKTEPHETEIKLELNRVKFKFTHGHDDKGTKGSIMKAHISLDNQFYDYWVHGHLHHFTIYEDDHGRMVVGVGSLMGRNNYSTKIKSATDASQAMFIVYGNGDVDAIRLGLQEA
jgi:predicted phosphodiesterase